MVGPVVGEGDQCESPRCFAAAPDLNRIAQRGVRYFWHLKVLQKSNEALSAATSLSLPSVSFSS
jgi:hypothetical protein